MSIVSTHPSLVKQWHPDNEKSPEDVTGGSSYRALWIDGLGHTWTARVADRALKGATCPYCANKKVLPGFNDLATTHPALAVEYHVNNELSPTEIVAGSLRKVSWEGPCGHTWSAKPSDRVRGTGCPYCVNQKILVGFNDLASVHPDLVREWDPTNSLTPTDVSYVSRTRVGWVCQRGHRWNTTVKSRTASGGTGCPGCVNVRQSKVEVYLRDTIETLFGEANQQHDTGLKWPSGQRVVVDVYVPAHNLIVEWDGSKWHSDRFAKDVQKSTILLVAGYKVLRLRERPLPLLEIGSPYYGEVHITHRVVEPYFTRTVVSGLESLGIGTV